MNTGKYTSSIWVSSLAKSRIEAIDQRFLPFETKIFGIETLQDTCYAIREMVVRGAPLIGVTAAFGMYLAALSCREENLSSCLKKAAVLINETRPTAINLFYATKRMLAVLNDQIPKEKSIAALFEEAVRIREEEAARSLAIGKNGLPLMEEIWKKKSGKPVQILTHCNAGWLACVQWGTATAPLYLAHEKGIPMHVWVDETRPRNQGARLTAYELGVAGIPHTVIPDNAGGHLMQHGMVDIVLVGSDRTTANGDVANKTGTYLKALAAFDNNIPFYAALPSSSIDWNLADGVTSIPIEERSSDEVAYAEGWDGHQITKVRLIPEGSKTLNYGFDVTPARLVTGLITERGICKADRKSIGALFADNRI